MTCKSIISTFHFFLNAAKFFQKRKPEPPRGFLPRPLLRAENQSRQSKKSFPPEKKIFALPSPHCSATCPNTWRAEPRKKNTLSFFKRNFTPAKSEMQGVFFFRGCRGFARQWRNDTSVRGSLEPPRAPRVRLVGIRVAFKIHSNFVQYTPIETSLSERADERLVRYQFIHLL